MKRWFFLFILLVSFTAQARWADHFVDLRDVAKYSADESHQTAAKIIMASVQEDPKAWFNLESVRFLSDGVGFEPETRINSVYGLEFEWMQKSETSTKYFMTGIYDVDGVAYFSRWNVVVDSESNVRVKRTQTVLLSKISFNTVVSLEDRKLVVSSQRYGIRKVYPMGVGGFDVGVSKGSKGKIRNMTPLFQTTRLNRDICYG